ncbi:MAG: PKD domain-containing protein [Bacteroidales bacterium]
MKKILYTMVVIALAMVSCEIEPDAYFYTDKVDVLTGEEIAFINGSYNAYRYEWDFGDGNRSTAENPVYAYSSTGTFQVMLAAISKRGNTNYAYQTITVNYPTTLEVTVLEYFDKYPVGGASVLLYPTLNDWDNETNALVEGITNSAGKVVITHLDPKPYFLDILETNHNNYAFRDEPDYIYESIITQSLLPNQINRFTAWVDYVGGKGEGSSVRRERKVVIVNPDR